VPPLRLQLVALKVPEPVVLQLTLPVGVPAAGAVVSETVAVHVTLTPAVVEVGVQLAAVPLDRLTTRLVVPLLPA
jgi:hypothetical protein